MVRRGNYLLVAIHSSLLTIIPTDAVDHDQHTTTHTTTLSDLDCTTNFGNSHCEKRLDITSAAARHVLLCAKTHAEQCGRSHSRWLLG